MTTSTNKIINKLATGTLSALLITSMPMTVAMQSANAAVANSSTAAKNLNNLLQMQKTLQHRLQSRVIILPRYCLGFGSLRQTTGQGFYQ
jgi:hypothetical protein